MNKNKSKNILLKIMCQIKIKMPNLKILFYEAVNKLASEILIKCTVITVKKLQWRVCFVMVLVAIGHRFLIKRVIQYATK